ncbi:MAG: DNA polymerase III subunit delta [Methylophilus sp.]|nr:DNA polymerase III subunit delta [Methylophilus sp.]
MQISANALVKHLSNTASPVVVIMGDEPLAKAECLDSVRQHARKLGAEERTSLLVERQFNWQTVTQFSQHFSLFSTHRILEIHIPSGKPGIDGAKVLTELAQQPTPETTTIITLPTLEREGKNSAWYSALLTHALVVELKDINIAQLPAWIQQRLALQQQTTDEASLIFMAQQVEGNMLAAHQEIQKLALLYPAGNLSPAQIKEAVFNVARFDAFQLGEAMLEGDSERTVRILQGLQEEGEQAVAVMNPLIWLIRPLLRVKQAEALGENVQSAMASARIFGDRQALIKKAAQRLSLRQIEAALQKLSDIDRMAKGVMQGDAWLEISRLCFGLARIKSRTR